MSRCTQMFSCFKARTCPVCDGLGARYVGSCGMARREPCPACAGTGTRRRRPRRMPDPVNTNARPQGAGRPGPGAP